MIPADTGFLYALADADDRWGERARQCATSTAEGWITTRPVLAEACHLLGRRLGPEYAAALMKDVADGGIAVWPPASAQLAKMSAMMRKHTKLPMDLADASLVLLAEHLGDGRILSTDQRDLGAYRWKNHKPFKSLLETTA